MEIIFNRQVRCVTKGVFRTAVDRDNDGVVVTAFYRHSRIKCASRGEASFAVLVLGHGSRRCGRRERLAGDWLAAEDNLPGHDGLVMASVLVQMR